MEKKSDEEESDESDNKESEESDNKKIKKNVKRNKLKGKGKKDTSDIFVKITDNEVQGRRKLHTGHTDVEFDNENSDDSSSLISLSISSSEGGSSVKKQSKKNSKKTLKKEKTNSNVQPKTAMASLFGNPGRRPDDMSLQNIAARHNMNTANEYSVLSPVSEDLNNETYSRNNLDYFEHQKSTAEPINYVQKQSSSKKGKKSAIKN